MKVIIYASWVKELYQNVGGCTLSNILPNT